MIQELIGKLFTGERDGLTIWKVMLSEIGYEPITDPSEGVLVASLAENILRFGLLQPILIRKSHHGLNGEKYKLVAGRRRLEAVRMLGHTHISAIVVACESDRAMAVALSENLLRKEPHYIDLANQITVLLKSGWKAERLAGMLAMTVQELTALVDLAALPSDELCTLRRMDVPKSDALRLLSFSSDVRKAILKKCQRCPEIGVSELISEMQNSPDTRWTQTHKWMVNDVRVFLNSLERSVSAMRDAGFDAKICKETRDDCYLLSIAVSKKQGNPLDETGVVFDVSRETRQTKRPTRRFSSALNIFEALAEEESGIGPDVSRETSERQLMFSCEK